MQRAAVALVQGAGAPTTNPRHNAGCTTSKWSSLSICRCCRDGQCRVKSCHLLLEAGLLRGLPYRWFCTACTAAISRILAL